MTNENSKTSIKVEKTILNSTASSSKNPVLQHDDHGCSSLINQTVATAIWNIPSTSTSPCDLYSNKHRRITVQNKIVILSDIKIQNIFGTEKKSADKICYFGLSDFCRDDNDIIKNSRKGFSERELLSALEEVWSYVDLDSDYDDDDIFVPPPSTSVCGKSDGVVIDSRIELLLSESNEDVPSTSVEVNSTIKRTSENYSQENQCVLVEQSPAVP
ncbi:unnamed protein product [Diabrotica balteata]|uniref:Uncharacterized protein n=1 Tax=Diabrotica balteata TaxID=107213 RepID=A0A9N9SN24_DIABA|nr:unnamed protein product [Diabrotica balteata]